MPELCVQDSQSLFSKILTTLLKELNEYSSEEQANASLACGNELAVNKGTPKKPTPLRCIQW